MIHKPLGWMIIAIVLLLTWPTKASGVACSSQTASDWQITAYDNCKLCTRKNPADKGYGITASGTKTHWGVVACNWFKFGTKLQIEGFDNVFTIEDRGSKSEFGDKNNHKKRLDLWFPTHKEALKFGRQKKTVTIL
jgi:3D (Asp-Asp-Asp) domain-containing protein